MLDPNDPRMENLRRASQITVAQKEIYTEEEVLLEYDFDSGSLEDLSGNDNNATAHGNIGINQGAGIELSGEDNYIKIDRFTGDISKGFNLSVDTICNALNGSTLVNLQQSQEAALGSSGFIETERTNGYKARLEYTTTPDLVSMIDVVEYKLIYSRDETAANTGQITYFLKDLIPSKTITFNLPDTAPVVLDTGTFNIGRQPDGTYSVANLYTFVSVLNTFLFIVKGFSIKE